MTLAPFILFDRPIRIAVCADLAAQRVRPSRPRHKHPNAPNRDRCTADLRRTQPPVGSVEMSVKVVSGQTLVTGSAQPNFGPSHLKQVEIVVPPARLQMQYEQIANKAMDSLRTIQSARAGKENLFNSLVQRAFRGEL